MIGGLVIYLLRRVHDAVKAKERPCSPATIQTFSSPPARPRRRASSDG